MYIMHVHIHVKPDKIGAFRDATIENARNSILEDGIYRFDVIQNQGDPSKFILIEAYRDADDQVKHRETEHYMIWRDTVGDMLLEPRTAEKFSVIYPDELSWKK